MPLNSCRNFISARHPRFWHRVQETLDVSEYFLSWLVQTFLRKKQPRAKTGRSPGDPACQGRMESRVGMGRGAWCGLEALACRVFQPPANSGVKAWMESYMPEFQSSRKAAKPLELPDGTGGQAVQCAALKQTSSCGDGGKEGEPYNRTGTKASSQELRALCSKRP